MGHEEIVVEQKDGIVTITMNRPVVLNAITSTMLRELQQSVDEAGRDANAGISEILRRYAAQNDIQKGDETGLGMTRGKKRERTFCWLSPPFHACFSLIVPFARTGVSSNCGRGLSSSLLDLPDESRSGSVTVNVDPFPG